MIKLNTRNNSPILKKYKQIAYSTPKLDKKKEIELLKEAKINNCPASIEILVNSYLRTVISLSNKYCYKNHLDMDDCVQAGIAGIMNAIREFDLKKYKVIKKDGGSLFAYFCYRAIIMELTKFYRSNIRQFSVTDSVNTQLQAINSLYKQGELNQIHDDFDNEKISDLLSKKLDISQKRVRELLHLFTPPVELDMPISDEEGQTLYKDFFVKTDKESEPSNIIEKESKYSFLLNLVAQLPKEERDLIEQKYGFGCEKTKMADIASKYKLTTSAVSKSIKSTEEKLKNVMIAADYGI